MTEETTKHSQPFDASTLLTLRESARTYQKLDLAYIAAGGAVATAFKLNSNDIIDLTAQLWGVVIAIIGLLAYDTFLEKTILLDWISSKQGSKSRLSSTVITSALTLQPFFHFMFIAAVVLGGLGFAQGSYSVTQMYKAEAEIQIALDHFIIKEKRMPNSIEELERKSSYAKRAFDIIGRSEIRIENATPSQEKYRITFPGHDGKLGTDDDNSVTAMQNLMDFYNSFRSGKKDK